MRTGDLSSIKGSRKRNSIPDKLLKMRNTKRKVVFNANFRDSLESKFSQSTKLN